MRDYISCNHKQHIPIAFHRRLLVLCNATLFHCHSIVLHHDSKMSINLYNGRIFYLFILSYRARLSYLIMALVLSLFFIYGCGLVSS